MSASERVTPREGAEWWKEETGRKKLPCQKEVCETGASEILPGSSSLWSYLAEHHHAAGKWESRITSSCGEVRVMLLIGRLCATTSGSSQRDSSRRHLGPTEVFERCHPIFISNDDFLTWLMLCVVAFQLPLILPAKRRRFGGRLASSCHLWDYGRLCIEEPFTSSRSFRAWRSPAVRSQPFTAAPPLIAAIQISLKPRRLAAHSAAAASPPAHSTAPRGHAKTHSRLEQLPTQAQGTRAAASTAPLKAANTWSFTWIYPLCSF